MKKWTLSGVIALAILAIVWGIAETNIAAILPNIALWAALFAFGTAIIYVVVSRVIRAIATAPLSAQKGMKALSVSACVALVAAAFLLVQPLIRAERISRDLAATLHATYGATLSDQRTHARRENGAYAISAGFIFEEIPEDEQVKCAIEDVVNTARDALDGRAIDEVYVSISTASDPDYTITAHLDQGYNVVRLYNGKTRYDAMRGVDKSTPPDLLALIQLSWKSQKTASEERLDKYREETGYVSSTASASIFLDTVENDVAYYNVELLSSITWKKNPAQEKIALEAIKKCRGNVSAAGAESFSVMGYESDGKIAFSWGGIDGVTKVRYYEDNKYSHAYFITAEDIE